MRLSALSQKIFALAICGAAIALGEARAIDGAAPAAASAPSTLTPPPEQRQFKGIYDPIGPLSLRDLDGRRFTEHDFSGKVLIVVQWAAWCGPCIDSFPDVQKLFRKVKRDPSLAFVSLNMDRDPAAISEFFKDFRNEYSFPVLLAGEHLKLRGLPCAWIVDREGYIREVLMGSGPGWLQQVLGLVESVRHRTPVSSLPPEAVRAQRERNSQEAARSR